MINFFNPEILGKPTVFLTFSSTPFNSGLSKDEIILIKKKLCIVGSHKMILNI